MKFIPSCILLLLCLPGTPQRSAGDCGAVVVISDSLRSQNVEARALLADVGIAPEDECSESIPGYGFFVLTVRWNDGVNESNMEGYWSQLGDCLNWFGLPTAEGWPTGKVWTRQVFSMTRSAKKHNVRRCTPTYRHVRVFDIVKLGRAAAFTWKDGTFTECYNMAIEYNKKHGNSSVKCVHISK